MQFGNIQWHGSDVGFHAMHRHPMHGHLNQGNEIILQEIIFMLQGLRFWAGLSLTVMVFGFSATNILMAAEGTETKPKPNESETNSVDEDYRLMKMFVETFKQIDSNYVKEVSRKDLVEAAIRGMVSELDPYSSFISSEDLDSFDQDVKQEFGGIGIQVSFDPTTRSILVISPLPGTPAYEAGIKAGDRIVQIEGKDVKDFKVGSETDTAIKLMKGPPGGKVKIGLQRDGENEMLNFSVERAIIKVATVMGDTYNKDGTWNYMLDNDKKIGYLRLTHFSGNSTTEMKKALAKLKEQGMKGLIIDLRFNPGGLLSSATEIADLFIESGKIVSTKGRNTPERTWEAKKRGTYTGFPIAVLINHYSASASEILSACLQDHKLAVVIGERSWGKGSVQNIIDVADGTSALKLTTASYHRPSGKNIHRFPGAKETDEWGVMPDEGYDVKYTSKQTADYMLYRQKRDILNEKGPDPENKYDDLQLKKALEYLDQKSGIAHEAANIKPEDAKAEAPKSDTPKKDEPKKDDAKSEEPKSETPKE
jgi:carboxyl-terminal processing protease